MISNVLRLLTMLSFVVSRVCGIVNCLSWSECIALGFEIFAVFFIESTKRGIMCRTLTVSPPLTNMVLNFELPFI